MNRTELVRVVVLAGFTVASSGCASHHAMLCANPAKVVGAIAPQQEGWIIVRDDRSTEETAARIAASYHVRTQTLTYVHGFSTYPVPQDPKLLCDKAVSEVHYAPSLVAR